MAAEILGRDDIRRELPVRNDDRPRARIAEHVRMIARGVRRVGRHGNATGRHDAEIGDQPFGAILADQANAVARLEPDALQPRRESRHLPRRLGPGDRVPFAVAPGPEKRLVILFRGARQEQLNQIVEMLELTRHFSPLPPGGAS